MLPSCQPQEGDGVAKVNAKREQYNVVQHCRLATMSDVSDSKRDKKRVDNTTTVHSFVQYPQYQKKMLPDGHIRQSASLALTPDAK